MYLHTSSLIKQIYSFGGQGCVIILRILPLSKQSVYSVFARKWTTSDFIFLLVNCAIKLVKQETSWIEIVTKANFNFMSSRIDKVRFRLTKNRKRLEKQNKDWRCPCGDFLVTCSIWIFFFCNFRFELKLTNKQKRRIMLRKPRVKKSLKRYTEPWKPSLKTGRFWIKMWMT